MSTETMTTSFDCLFCGLVTPVTAPMSQWIAFEAGVLIQDAFPDMPANTRELILTGMCDTCWDNTFGES